jgi:putative peptide zinc metalloprotease protein
VAATSTDERAQPSRPELSPGIELLGELEGSGFKQPQYFARDQQGQVIQLPQWLFLVASQIDGQRTTEEIAGRISKELGRSFTAEDVDYLIDSQLRPLGVVADTNGGQAVAAADPLLGLKLKTAVVPPRAVHALSTVFAHFFHLPVVLAALAAFVAADVWFFGLHGVAQPARELVYNPILLVMVFALVVVATALHEIGHASATRYGGGKPGAMGVGIYIVWPAFYTDITDSYRLGRGARLRTDLGGIYFNVIFTLSVFGAYALTGFEPLLVLVVIQHVQIVQQLLPFLRLDGYYILADLTGVPDMFSRIKPTLKSALPWRDSEPRADELKRWVRVVTTAWVVFLVPVLLFMFGSIIINLPRMAATAWDSLQLQLDRITGGDGLEVAAGVIQASALVLPIVGITYTLTRASMRLGSASWQWSESAPLRRALVIAMGAAIAAVAGYVLYPNGDYRAIQPGERGTLVGAIEQFAALPSGRPGLTEERARELGLEPTTSTPTPATPAPTGPATRPGSRRATPERSPVPRPGTQTAGGADNSQPPPGPESGQTVTTPTLPQPAATVSTPLVTTSATLPTPPPVTVTTPPTPVPAPTVPVPTPTVPVEPPLPGVPVP